MIVGAGESMACTMSAGTTGTGGAATVALAARAAADGPPPGRLIRGLRAEEGAVVAAVALGLDFRTDGNGTAKVTAGGGGVLAGVLLPSDVEDANANAEAETHNKFLLCEDCTRREHTFLDGTRCSRILSLTSGDNRLTSLC